MNKKNVTRLILRCICLFVLLVLSMLLHYVSNPLDNKLACQENKPVRQRALCYRHTSSVSTTRSVHKIKNHGTVCLVAFVVGNQVK